LRGLRGVQSSCGLGEAVGCSAPRYLHVRNREPQASEACSSWLHTSDTLTPVQAWDSVAQ
jgi:hypothetical protein